MTDCHKDIRRLLCLFYMPYCPDKGTAQSLLPCRELCTEVKSKCERTIANYNFAWPPSLDCAHLPRYEQNGLTCAGYQSNSGKGDFCTGISQVQQCPPCRTTSYCNRNIGFVLWNFAQNLYQAPKTKTWNLKIARETSLRPLTLQIVWPYSALPLQFSGRKTNKKGM